MGIFHKDQMIGNHGFTRARSRANFDVAPLFGTVTVMVSGAASFSWISTSKLEAAVVAPTVKISGQVREVAAGFDDEADVGGFRGIDALEGENEVVVAGGDGRGDAGVGLRGIAAEHVFEGVGDAVEVGIGIGGGVGNADGTDPTGKAGRQRGEFDLLVGEVVSDLVAAWQAGDGGERRAGEDAETGDDELGSRWACR